MRLATEKRLHALLNAVPASDRDADGMPLAAVIERIAETITDAVSAEERREMAEEAIRRAVEINLEVRASIGAAQRVRDAQSGEVRYRMERELTPDEDEAIDMLTEAALQRSER